MSIEDHEHKVLDGIKEFISGLGNVVAAVDQMRKYRRSLEDKNRMTELALKSSGIENAQYEKFVDKLKAELEECRAENARLKQLLKM